MTAAALVADTLELELWADALYRPAFPVRELVGPAVAGIRAASGYDRTPGTAAEGPSWFVSVAPGRIRIGSVDLAKSQRRQAREIGQRVKLGNESAAYRERCEEIAAYRALWAAGLQDDVPLALVRGFGESAGTDPRRPGTRRSRISEWSAKSRNNMRDRIATLDFGPLVGEGVPAMCTLTLPDDWQAYAPTGAHFKALVRRFAKRYERAWKRRLRGLWKLEFQRRGAPHLHVLMVPPTGEAGGLRWRQWFARTWADVVLSSRSAGGIRHGELIASVRAAMIAVHEHRKASADYAEGLRAADPKRIAVYFSKHNLLRDKEYQHVVPGEWRGEGEGPGRFWGYWGLERADSSTLVTDAEAVSISRTLRRWQRARRGVYRASVVRVDTRTGTIRRRTVLRRVAPMRGTRGFLLVNDGPAVALMLADSLRT